MNEINIAEKTKKKKKLINLEAYGEIQFFNLVFSNFEEVVHEAQIQ